jgi:hypothetical protein
MAGRNNGGLLVVGRELVDNESIDASRSKIEGFVGEVMRASTMYFPRE